MFPAQCNKEI
uniref:Uncharacterized protein n=1 Tax=Anguilla anguilla TaxID=7936 RepID=A0A0E9VML1_ANGAN